MRLIYAFVILTVLISCERELKFDSKKWKEAGDLDVYPYRESMIRDIVDRKMFVGQKYHTVIDSLGHPENLNNKGGDELWYKVTTDYGSDIDPVYSKHLILTLNNDSAVNKVEIREWRTGDCARWPQQKYRCIESAEAHQQSHVPVTNLTKDK